MTAKFWCASLTSFRNNQLTWLLLSFRYHRHLWRCLWYLLLEISWLTHIKSLPTVPHPRQCRAGNRSVFALLCIQCLLLLLLICLELFAHALTQPVDTESKHPVLQVHFPHLFTYVDAKLRRETAVYRGWDLPIDAPHVIILHLSALPHRVSSCRFTPSLLRQHHF